MKSTHAVFLRGFVVVVVVQGGGAAESAVAGSFEGLDRRDIHAHVGGRCILPLEHWRPWRWSSCCPGKETPRLEALLPEGFHGLYIPRRVEDGDWSSIRRARLATRAEVYDR